MITNDDSQKLLEEDCFGLLELLTTDTIKIINVIIICLNIYVFKCI